MERELQNIIQQLMSEYMRSSAPEPAPVSAPEPVSAPASVPAPVQQRQSIQIDPNLRNQQIMDTLAMLTEDYSKIMRGYNDNMYSMINVLRDCITVPPNPNRHPRRERQVPTRTTYSSPSYTNTTTQAPPTRTANSVPIFTYLFYPERTRQEFQDVVVRPTQQQINTATERITFSIDETNINIRCPITLEEFQEGDSLCQIIPCSHLFRELPLRNWFRSNVRCPVCRYDIRNYLVDLSNNPATFQDASFNNIEEDASDNETPTSIPPLLPSNAPRRSPIRAVGERLQSVGANLLSSGIDQTIDNVLNSFSQNLSSSLLDILQNYDQTGSHSFDVSGNTLELTIEEELYVD